MTSQSVMDHGFNPSFVGISLQLKLQEQYVSRSPNEGESRTKHLAAKIRMNLLESGNIFIMRKYFPGHPSSFRFELFGLGFTKL